MRKSPPTVCRIPITKARINLGQLAKRAHLLKEYFILEKDGIPVIGIMDADELEDYLEIQDPKTRSIIADGTAAYWKGKSRKASDFLAEPQSRSRPPRKRKS